MSENRLDSDSQMKGTEMSNQDHQTPPFDRQQKEEAWNYALGMIKIDGLEPSEEFKRYIELEKNGQLTTSDIKALLNQKYKMKETE